MKKLQYISMDYISNNDLEPDEGIHYTQGDIQEAFESGFKKAFKMLNEALEEQKEELKAYPMLTERKQAINNIQKKLNELLVE